MRGRTSFYKIYKGQHFKKVRAARSGRDTGLVEQRNELIMYRYHYYGMYTGKRYDTILKALGNEFYLSSVTIGKIIESHADLRRHILDENPSLIKLKRKYDFLKWE